MTPPSEAARSAPVTPDDLDRLEALAAAADAGPIGRVRFDTAVEQGDTALCLSPSVVSELIAAARLGAAWQAAEAALAEGWCSLMVYHFDDGNGSEHTPDTYGAKALDPDSPSSMPAEVYGYGPTPAAALLSLAEALRGRK